MFSSETKEMVYMSISLILTSIVLYYMAFLIDVRGDLGNVRQQEVTSADKLYEYRKYNKYDGTTLYGEDVVEAVRNNYENITIRVNDEFSTDTYTKEFVKANPTLIDIASLQALYSTNKVYKSVLVYGNDISLSSVTSTSKFSSVNNEVSAIVLFYQGVR